MTFPSAANRLHRDQPQQEGDAQLGDALVRDLLMLAPSFKVWPVAPVDLARSLPARSTSLREESQRGQALRSGQVLAEVTHEMRETFSASRPVWSSCVFWVKIRVKMACDRDDVSFICVAAIVLALLPSAMSSSGRCKRVSIRDGSPSRQNPYGPMSSKELTTSLDRSSTYGPSDGCSRTLRLLQRTHDAQQRSVSQTTHQI
jgi:hypothetical protein